MTTSNSARRNVFISSGELAQLIKDKSDLVILHVKSPDGKTAPEDEYGKGHIAGAHFVNLATDLASLRDGLSGDRPLPSPGALQENIRKWGIHPGSVVVAYDNNNGLSAGRAWWVLRWAGVPDVRLLDGGLAHWVNSGNALSKDLPKSVAGSHVVYVGQLPTLDADGAAAIAREGVLLDARGEKQYTAAGQYYTVAGVQQFIGTPGEPPQGHIPGAINAPASENLRSDGLLRDSDDLHARFRRLGSDGSKPIGVYCGAGVSSAYEVAVLASLGIPSSLFVGSWSAWSSDPARPVATGSEPG